FKTVRPREAPLIGPSPCFGPWRSAIQRPFRNTFPRKKPSEGPSASSRPCRNASPRLIAMVATVQIASPRYPPARIRSRRYLDAALRRPLLLTRGPRQALFHGRTVSHHPRQGFFGPRLRARGLVAAPSDASIHADAPWRGLFASEAISRVPLVGT